MIKETIEINKDGKNKIFSIKNISGKDKKLIINFSTDIDPKIIFSISEMLRFIQTIGGDDFKFNLELTVFGNKNIPLINLSPVDAGIKSPLIVFLHGFETSKEKVLRYGMHLAAAGFYTSIMDLPDHGERIKADFDEKYKSKGSMKKSWMNRLELFKESLDDVKELINIFSKDEKIDTGRIGISGISMGGTLSLLTAYNDPRIKAAASFLSILGYEKIPGISSKDDYSQEELQFIRSLDPLFVFREKPAAAILAQFGEKDDITESSALKEFEKKLRGIYSSQPERFKLLKENNIGHDVNLNMIKKSLEWFKKYL